MGKIKNDKRFGSAREAINPMGGAKVPLADEIESLKLAKAAGTAGVGSEATVNNTKMTAGSSNKAQGAGGKRQANEDEFVNEQMTAKILMQARQQQSELVDEYGLIGQGGEGGQNEDENNNNVQSVDKNQPAMSSTTTSLSSSRPFKKFQSNFQQQQKIRKSDHDDSDTDSDDNLDTCVDNRYNVDEEIKVNEEDQKAFDTFMSKKEGTRRTIADIIMEKLSEKKTDLSTQMSQMADNDDQGGVQNRPGQTELDDRVVKMYTQIKEVLHKYRSGKLPKAFKILPSLSNWEHILYITEPDMWSAAAVYQATRIFASNLNAKMAQRFFSIVLLPRVRDDIQEYKRLNFHLYMALRKALFKPAAFFKGVLLPLCEGYDCNLREAIILGSVLAKNSIPMLHSAAALLKIAEMEYSGANSIFIRILLDKKYALPYRVIDALVHHFIQFQFDTRAMPVLWHQSLLTFVQRYKSDISTEQKEALLELIKKKTHFEITNEVRRELSNARCRDIDVNEDANSQHSIDLNLDDNKN